MRQRLSDKKTKALSDKLGMDIKSVMVRGNTEHRKDIYTKDGRQFALYKDGQLEEVEKFILVK